MTGAARQLAYRNTLRLCVIVFGVGSASVFIDVARYGFWPLGAAALAHGLQGGVLGLWMWRRGKAWSARASDLAYVALLAPYLFTIWLPPVYDHHAGALVEPLIAHHFVLLGIAILPPSSLRWGVALLGGFATHGVALWAVLEGRAPSPTLEREPWFTLLFAGIAVGMLWSRWRRRGLEVRLAVAEARADTLDRLNRVLLALRDRGNTPLQTLEIAIGLVEKRAPPDDPALQTAVAAMRRAMGQLVEAQQPLTRATEAGRDRLDLDLDHELRELRELPGTGAPRDA